MKIFPAIDLMNGEAVRLTKGKFDTKEVMNNDPVAVKDWFEKQGAECLHIVDLDGAKNGTIANFETISRLCSDKKFFVEVGGGIRDLQKIENYLKLGVSRTILGTIAISNFDFVVEAVKEFGDVIAVGVDAFDEKVAIHGWEEVTKVQSFDFCQKCRDYGVKTVIYTDISKDGAMQGTNLEAYQKLSKIENLQIVASGGISTLDEIKQLCDMEIYGAILGKSLYKGRIDLKSALEVGSKK